MRNLAHSYNVLWLLQVHAPVELDADSLERILNLVSDRGLLRGTHTARLVSRSWCQAVDSRAHRLRQVSNLWAATDTSKLLSKTPNITALDMAFCSISSAGCKQLHGLQLKELCFADCSRLAPMDLHCLHQLTGLQVLKLSNLRTTASSALSCCSSLLRLHTLDFRDFRL